jgi:hypothetical protein
MDERLTQNIQGEFFTPKAVVKLVCQIFNVPFPSPKDHCLSQNVSKILKGISKDDPLCELLSFEAPPREIKEVITREGQQAFRRGLIEIHGTNCAITGECPIEVIDAAHIVNYSDNASQRLDNGILLRADIHRLYDRKLISICPYTLLIKIDKTLSSSIYWEYNGKKLKTVDNSFPHPFFLKAREIISRGRSSMS